MSSVIEDSITSGRLSPYEQSLISRGSKRSRTRNISLLAQSQEYATGNAFSFKAHQETSRGRLTTMATCSSGLGHPRKLSHARRAGGACMAPAAEAYLWHFRCLAAGSSSAKAVRALQ